MTYFNTLSKQHINQRQWSDLYGSAGPTSNKIDSLILVRARVHIDRQVGREVWKKIKNPISQSFRIKQY